MPKLHHTMHIAASVQATRPVTFAQVPGELHAREDDIITELLDCEFLQDSFHFDEFLSEISTENELRQEISEENRGVKQCSENEIVISISEQGSAVRDESESKLIAPREISSDRDVSGEDGIRRKLKRSTPSPKSSKKSLASVGCWRKREKANRREKERIVVMKNAMNVLKNAIPTARAKTKITKLEILKLAQEYISSLAMQLLEDSEEAENDDKVASSTAPFVFDQEDMFVYCGNSQQDYEVTMGNSWDSLP